MSTEQNVRMLEEQTQWMAQCIKASGDHPSLEGFLREHIRIAEARGAAEQRRKDAEGQEPFAWRYYDEEDDDGRGGWRYSSLKPSSRYEDVRPLYTHPANVAALEARIAELRSDNQRIRTAAEQVCSKREPASIYEARIALRTVLRSAGVPAPNPIQAMTNDQLSERLKAVQARWDDLMESEEELGSGSPMESMDEEMQDLENEIARRAALTREGGV